MGSIPVGGTTNYTYEILRIWKNMTKSSKIQLFNDRKVRTVWDSEAEEWYFSVVDVVGVPTDSDNPRRYLSDLKRKLKKGSKSTKISYT